MSSKKIYDGITGIRDDIIERAENYQFRKDKKLNKKSWAKWGTMAACLCLIVGAGAVIFSNFGAKKSSGTEEGNAAGTIFMSCSGPLLPLTTISDASGIEVERNIDFDFSPYKWVQEGTVDIYGEESPYTRYYTESIISDDYVLKNTTGEDIELTAVYGFAGSFSDEAKYFPNVMINDSNVEADFHAGRYTGNFFSAHGLDTEEIDKSNLLELTEWQSYETLLAKGDYLEDALAEYPKLEQKVIVYKLSDFDYDGSDDSATNPTIDLSFNMDKDNTVIMTWGASGGSNDEETRTYHRHYDIPEERERGYGKDNYLIVLGEDIENLVVQGYKAGIYEEGKELDGAAVDIVRYEAVLGDVIWDIMIEEREEEFEESRILDYVSDEMLYGTIAELLYDYGVLSDDVIERYDFGSLEDMVSESYHMDRVMYLTFDIVVPENESVKVSISMVKDGSYDYYGDNESREGYDMMTTLGSSFTYTGQNASISNTDDIVIVGQNFGFDLENDINEVPLDINEPHYYLEVSKIEE